MKGDLMRSPEEEAELYRQERDALAAELERVTAAHATIFATLVLGVLGLAVGFIFGALTALGAFSE
jgi:hypothetical protein